MPWRTLAGRANLPPGPPPAACRWGIFRGGTNNFAVLVARRRWTAHRQTRKSWLGVRLAHDGRPGMRGTNVAPVSTRAAFYRTAAGGRSDAYDSKHPGAHRFQRCGPRRAALRLLACRGRRRIGARPARIPAADGSERISGGLRAGPRVDRTA